MLLLSQPLDYDGKLQMSAKAKFYYFLQGRNTGVLDVVFNVRNARLGCPYFFGKLLLGHAKLQTRVLDKCPNLIVFIYGLQLVSVRCSTFAVILFFELFQSYLVLFCCFPDHKRSN